MQRAMLIIFSARGMHKKSSAFFKNVSIFEAKLCKMMIFMMNIFKNIFKKKLFLKDKSIGIY